MQKNTGSGKIINEKSIKAIIFGVITGILVIVLLFLISAFIVTKMNSYPEKIIDYVILAILAFGGLFAGFITGRKYKSSGLLYGAITGLILFIMVFLSGVSEINQGITIITLFKLITLLLTSSIGGILGVNRKDKIHIK